MQDIHASLEIDAFTVDQPAAVAQLRCVGRTQNVRIVSLGGVIDTQLDSIPDIALVAAHGLGHHAGRCVMSFRGHQLGVSRIQKGQGDDADGDWAVLTLDGRFPKHIHRLGWYSDAADNWESFARQGGRVALLKFANGETGKSCDIRIPRGGMRDSADSNALILSDCVSMPGMSGAPAIVEVDGLPTIIGLNIGTRYDLSAPPLEWRSRASLIRLVDTVVEDAIVRAIALELPQDRQHNIPIDLTANEIQ